MFNHIFDGERRGFLMAQKPVTCPPPPPKVQSSSSLEWTCLWQYLLQDMYIYIYIQLCICILYALNIYILYNIHIIYIYIFDVMTIVYYNINIWYMYIYICVCVMYYVCVLYVFLSPRGSCFWFGTLSFDQCCECLAVGQTGKPLEAPAKYMYTYSTYTFPRKCDTQPR